MYIPAAFRETSSGKSFDLILIERHNFGLLVSDFDGTPFATYLPLLLDRMVAPHGCLIGHMARANRHWEKADGKTALAVLTGPDAYVFPTSGRRAIGRSMRYQDLPIHHPDSTPGCRRSPPASTAP